MTPETPPALATFGAGSFWDTEAAFRHRRGVIATRVGFMGGTLPDPGYEDVASGTTGHVEVVQVAYDPAVTQFEDLLEIFWAIHDPTSAGGQGDWTGPQYRPVIFVHDEGQREAAERSREAVASSGVTEGRPIVTAIEPAGEFWPAGEEHQQFYEKLSQGNSVLRQQFDE